MSFREIFLGLPALDAPKGVTWNPENPPGNPAMALSIMVPCLIVTTLMTFLRLYVKTFIVRKWHLEDYLLPFAFLFSAAEFVAALHVYTYAPVIHQWDMTLRTVSKFLLDFHVGAIFYDATIMMLKICILLQFLRIFVPTGEKRVTFWTTHILIWMNTIFYTITIFVEIFACNPIRKAWDPLITRGKCINTPAAYLTSQSFNLALDLLILVWTQAIIWRLHMAVRQKLKLGVLFIAGLSACIFGACSVWINVEIFNTEDQAYWGAWMALFTFPETTSGFLVFCLPVVPKFIKHAQTKLFPSTVKNSTGPPSGRGRTFEEGGKRASARASGGKPRSWWHISAANTKLSSLASKLTGTTWTNNGSPRNSKQLQSLTAEHDRNKTDVAFITFGQSQLDLRFDHEDQQSTHEHGHIYVQREYAVDRGYDEDRIERIESERQGSEHEMDEFITRPKNAHSHV